MWNPARVSRFPAGVTPAPSVKKKDPCPVAVFLCHPERSEGSRAFARFSQEQHHMEIAWIGTGIMGAPMARRLLGGHHRVRVFNRSPEKARALAADGAIVAADAAACVAGAEVVFIMVPDTPDVEATVAKIEPALKAGQLVVDMSTVSPAAERAIAMRFKLAGVDYLDAPVSGGDVGARDGTLAIMVGGDAAAFERARPLFDLLGKRITYMGASGAGPDDEACESNSGRTQPRGGGRSDSVRQSRRSRRVAECSRRLAPVRRGRGSCRTSVRKLSPAIIGPGFSSS